MGFWTAEMRRFKEAQQRLGERLNLMEVHYQDLLGYPVRHVREIYRRAGTQLDDRGEAAVNAWLQENPAGKHGKNVYQLEHYGLNPSAVDAGFREIGRAHVCTPVTNAHLV